MVANADEKHKRNGLTFCIQLQLTRTNEFPLLHDGFHQNNAHDIPGLSV